MSRHSLSVGEIALRLLIAAILGSLVGWDRQRKSGVAGLRTHMLVCVGSALVMIVSAYGFEDILDQPNVVLDPSRIAAQVISGISFLGAGTILLLRQQVVRGLTTAAGLWSVAAVGLAVGGGMYIAGALATVIIVLILAVIKPLESILFKAEKYKTILLNINIQQINIAEVESVISGHGLDIGEITLNQTAHKDVYHMKLTFENKSDKKTMLAMVEQLNSKNGISSLIAYM